jgi:uncharacterized membrane protein SirB2
VLPEFFTAGSWLRTVHVASATASLALFVLRGTWMLLDSPLREARWTRIVPHVVDTVFLAAGIALAVRLQQYPFVQPWLTAKGFGLIAYIVLGSIALKHGRTRAIRATAFVAALAVFAYIAGVARARHPLSWGLWLGA